MTVNLTYYMSVYYLSHSYTFQRFGSGLCLYVKKRCFSESYRQTQKNNCLFFIESFCLFLQYPNKGRDQAFGVSRKGQNYFVKNDFFSEKGGLFKMRLQKGFQSKTGLKKQKGLSGPSPPTCKRKSQSPLHNTTLQVPCAIQAVESCRPLQPGMPSYTCFYF